MVDNAVLFLNTIRWMAIYPLDSVIRSLTNPTQIFDGLPTCSRELVEGPRYFQVDLWQVLCVLQGSALLKVSYKKAVIDRFHLATVALVRFSDGRCMWVDFIVGSRPCAEDFSTCPPVFLSEMNLTLNYHFKFQNQCTRRAT